MTQKAPALPLVTIDSESTRDIDDAFSIRGLPGGQVELLVAIADPSTAVPVGSKADTEAQALAASIYARDRTVKRMLPQDVSENASSLVQGQERDAMVLRILLDAGSVKVLEFAVDFRRVEVTHRLTYGEIPARMGGDDEPLREALRLSSALASGLFESRVNRGALALFDAKRMVMTDEEGRLLRMANANAMVGHLIIQEFMILANAQLAQFMARESIPGVYRNHEPMMAAPASGELAKSLRAWMETGSLDMDALNSRVGMSVGRARYAPTLNGHYGLALPAYAHGTSPLRRYADLINVRQLKAYTYGNPPPYSQAQLHEMCESINTTLTERKDETSAFHKEVLRRETEDRLERASLQGAPDQILVQATKLASQQQEMPVPLREELMSRMKAGTLSDKVADGLISELALAAWPRDLADCFVDWMSAGPGRVMHLLLYARQSGVLQTVDLQTTGQGTAFEGVCRISRDSTPYTGRAKGTRKKDAEQGAALDALSKMLGCATPPMRWAEPEDEPLEVGGVAIANPKGALLEFCQAVGWTFPSFKHKSTGPSHAPYFTASVEVHTPKGPYQTQATATSKKQAEANACAELLPVLQREFPVKQGASSPVGAQNQVGELQEMAQQGRYRIPEYSIAPKQTQPPIFEAVVTVFADGKEREFSGFASSKGEAKRNAAAKALAAMATR